MRGKELLLVAILFLVIGFAGVNTVFNAHGTVALDFNSGDFDVRFSKATVDEGDATISKDGQSISFFQDTYNSTLNYEITNNSKNYDANVDVLCTVDSTDENIVINNNLDNSLIESTKFVNGNTIIELPYYKTLYSTLVKNSVSDNVKSEFVNATTGIDYNKISSDSNGKGIYRHTSSEKSIYYYRGDVKDNHVLYADYCWLIVRTTETGGIKLLYNGSPDENGSCASNTGNNSVISSSVFNDKDGVPAYVGYMYGSEDYKRVGYVSSSTMIMTRGFRDTYYYADELAYDEVTKRYYLKDPYLISGDADLSVLESKYTFFSTNKDAYSDKNVNCIAGVEGTTIYYYVVDLNGGNVDNLLDNYYYIRKFSNSFIRNADGTITLDNPVTIKPGDWYKNYENYEGYYVCLDSTTTCDIPYYVVALKTDIKLVPVGVTYGNSFEYVDGKYHLKDTFEIKNWKNELETLSDYHYTCLNFSGVCEEVYYLSEGRYYYYKNVNPAIAFISLKNGESVDDALNLMYENNIDSTIKKNIDTWYESYIKGTIYESMLEDTVWCNNRTIFRKGSWDPNGGSVTTEIGYASPEAVDLSFSCPYKDSFTVSGEFGNGKLNYPIGLLTKDEIVLAGAPSTNRNLYLYNGVSWHLMTPHSSNNQNFVYDYYELGYFINYATIAGAGVRPSISLKNNVVYDSGDGTGDNPYHVVLSETENKSTKVTCELEVKAISRSEYIEEGT